MNTSTTFLNWIATSYGEMIRADCEREISGRPAISAEEGLAILSSVLGRHGDVPTSSAVPTDSMSVPATFDFSRRRLK